MTADPADWIESAARDQPHRIFLTTPAGREVSYASLRDQSGRFAAALMRRGVVPGDRVAVQVDKSVDAVLLYVACLRMGAVFGVPHPDFGEGVTAVVVPERGTRLSEADIISALKKRLAGYKVPKRVLIIDELPKNSMGKVQKNALRAGYAALYGTTLAP